MKQRCKESNHRWKNNGEEFIKIDLMTQPQICMRCDATRDYVASMSSDEKKKAPWVWIAIAALILTPILYLILHK
ncbi:hypothetical protein C1X34_30760 [Pseudomonas sp. GW456-12-10-14-TSB6]|nr:hypothetical protein C1X55_29635 [Pseudomonas sp. GW460-C8]PMW10532.1 hypothetical protein C1X40_30205 [Pseudomonas sp. GW456-11-11-14-TSB2]PMW12495.1 hypothetical protein C1X53_30675 [Pseudomonas sp. GW456-E6]PMW28799.1 hypothetical protein C1X45_30190 [Pseudomonas sp. GW460-7]PMW41254.1 hypothetical protein C1X48_07365 [Pseudomonas sp. FW305-3-2-15-A-R2A1]PMW57835.1 hypothetical protein C1X31_24765 [Pseudomonas sp. GW456-11-11-14-LB2]PMW62846.1 hypothetical protein C1X39_04350 [Pseudomon